MGERMTNKEEYREWADRVLQTSTDTHERVQALKIKELCEAHDNLDAENAALRREIRHLRFIVGDE